MVQKKPHRVSNQVFDEAPKSSCVRTPKQSQTSNGTAWIHHPWVVKACFWLNELPSISNKCRVSQMFLESMRVSIPLNMLKELFCSFSVVQRWVGCRYINRYKPKQSTAFGCALMRLFYNLLSCLSTIASSADRASKSSSMLRCESIINFCTANWSAARAR